MARSPVPLISIVFSGMIIATWGESAFALEQVRLGKAVPKFVPVRF